MSTTESTDPKSVRNPASDPDARPQVNSSVRGTITFGIVTLVLFLGGFVTWTVMAPLNSAVMGSAVLVVESNRRDVQHLEGGIVRSIHVKEGDEVNEGDILVTLDPTRANASLHISRSQVDASRALLARYRAEVVNADAIAFPRDVLARITDDPDLGDVVRAQNEIFAARKNARHGQVSVLRQRIGQLTSQITGYEAQERARQRQISLVQQELDGVNDLLRGGFATRTRALSLSRELARLQGDQGEYTSTLARTQQQIGEAELQILQIERTFQEEVAKGVQDIQNALREQQERFIAAGDVVNHLEIRSPASGTVVGLTVFTSGGVISPGRTVMQIVPRGDTLIVEAQIPTQDIEVVHEGQDSIIRFPALPQRSLPTLTGRVIHVSADRLTDERTGVSYFKVRVQPSEESLAKIAARRLVPGMPAEVAIATGSRTAAMYLIEPVVDALRHAMRER